MIFAVASLLAYRVGDRPDRPPPSARGQVDCRIFLEDAGHMDCDAQAIPYDRMTRVCAGWSSAGLRLGAGLLVKQHSMLVPRWPDMRLAARDLGDNQ